MSVGDCTMCSARDVEVLRTRIEIAIAFAKDLARAFDTFPATSLLDYTGLLCPECIQVAVRTAAFFQRERLARGGA